MSLIPRETPNRVILMDALGGAVIRLGGLGIICAVFAILFFIGREALPLFLPASARIITTHPGAVSGPRLAAGLDDTQRLAWTLDGTGVVSLVDAATWEARGSAPLPGAAEHPIACAYKLPQADLLLAGTRDGRLLAARLKLDNGIELESRGAAEVAEGDAIVSVAGRHYEEEIHAVAITASRRLFVVKLEDGDAEVTPLGLPAGEVPVRALVDGEGDKVFALCQSGKLVHWQTGKSTDEPFAVYDAPAAAITAIAFVIGDGQLLVGDAQGGIAVWSGVRDNPRDSLKKFRPIYTLPPVPGAVTSFIPAGHSRGFLVTTETGVFCGFTTSQKLFPVTTLAAPVAQAVYGPKLDRVLLLDTAGTATLCSLSNPHPEITWRTLFGRVWYEGFDQPEHFWQSSSGSDSFEAKFSLTPLVLGTMKGAFYGLLFAVPLAVLAALYTSQFMPFEQRSVIKPVVELMAAMPSVVIGFLAGLWLAPLLETRVMFVLLLLPLAGAATLVAYAGLRATRWGATPSLRLWLCVAAVLAGSFAAWAAGPWLEAWWFGGDFRQAVFNATGQAFEQRNCIVIGIAMGFAVIPIIYTISEDALSNVPKPLVSGSLALGASRWQTALRVVLPTASPGIFSAIMIGLGRAVGETMIVLMATGNTPVMSFSPFNGMRTLSANIAVEVPEAAVASTHYRVLFLAAVLLFAMTFVLNTAAEIVRQRLRTRYEGGAT